MLKTAFASVRHDRRRYTPIAVVVTIAGLMLVAQLAIAMGVFRDAAAPIGRSGADLWAGPLGAQGLGQGGALDPSQASALWLIPEMERIEPYATRFGELTARPRNEAATDEFIPGRYVSLIVVPTGAHSMLYSRHLPPQMRQSLAEPGTIVIGDSDAATLGVAVGGRVWLDNRPLRVAGTVPGMAGLGMSTALIGPASVESTEAAAFWLIGLRAGTSPERVAEITDSFTERGIGLWPTENFEAMTVTGYAFGSGAGTIFLASAGLALIVAALVVSQTMKSAVAGSVREYAALRAFGMGFGRLSVLVLMQGVLVGLASMLMLGLGVAGLVAALTRLGVPFSLPPALALGCVAAIFAVVLLSNLVALVPLRRADPAALLR